MPYYQGLDLERLPTVDLVVPNHLHAAYAQASLEAECHVLLEQSMATSVNDAARLLRAWQESGRIMRCAFPRCGVRFVT